MTIYTMLMLVKFILAFFGFLLLFLQLKSYNKRISSALITIGVTVIILSMIILLGTKDWIQLIDIALWIVIVVLNIVE